MAVKSGGSSAAPQFEGAAASLRELMDRLRAEIAAKRTEVMSLSGDLSAGDDFEMMAQSDSIAEVDTAEILRDLRELRSAEHAMARIEAGVYGQCAQCDQPIAPERLRVQPVAVYCVSCQQAREDSRAT